jgi:formylglycine-generating enzyme required for sulfatase activity
LKNDVDSLHSEDYALSMRPCREQVMKCSPQQRPPAAIIVVALSALMICLQRPEPSAAIIGQVGPKAKPPGAPAKRPNKGAKKSSKADPMADVTNSANWARIPPGEFLMGSDNSTFYDERPVHRVRISQSFEMGKYEVTQAQWQAVTRNNPSHFKGTNLPVDSVSWNDAQRFIQRLSARNDGHVYRLPTEAEWEYACRAGSTGDYAGDLDAMAWYRVNSGSKVHPVGTKQPNSWGLYDMHGNLYEWCQDWYDREYYARSPIADPQGPLSGFGRVSRGGFYLGDPQVCRSVWRLGNPTDFRSESLGFRLVRTNR